MLMSGNRFDAFRGCGGCGPTQGSWRCAPCERESELEGYAHYGDEVAGSVTAAVAATGQDPNATALHSILTGVATGVAVWALTRFLDSTRLARGRRR